MSRAHAKRELGKALLEIVAGAGGGLACIPVGLMSAGSELGREELLRGARLAMRLTPGLKVLPIGPILPGYEDLEWVKAEESEASITRAMDEALVSGHIAGAVALHYPFPIGVSTIGCVAAPGSGRQLFLASCTGNPALERIEAMIRSAVYGMAVAKASGIPAPSLGVLNLEGAPTVQRLLTKLHDDGYAFTVGQSHRVDGGMILRGNDLLSGSVDVAVMDSLTGNVLVKMMSASYTGGRSESMGWGYGPSVGEAWDKIVSIISRASGATVIANALALTARMARANLPVLVAAELAAARAAGLGSLLVECSKNSENSGLEAVPMPPEEPVDEELAGVDVLSAEDAKLALWKRGIYAEPYMGCTGLVLKVSVVNKGKARSILEELGYL